MFDLAFLRPNKPGDYDRENLLVQFDKSEKIATELEFALPPQQVNDPVRNCGHIFQNDEEGAWLCTRLYGNAPCMEGEMCPISDRGHYQNLLSTIFEPSRSQIDAGKKGFGEIKQEGSLPHGLEITTVGRRIIYRDLLTQNHFAISSLLNLNCSVNWRCGLHYHYLLGYYPAGGTVFNEAQCSIPVEVLANVWQINTLFADVLLWLTSAGPTSEFATRYLKFRIVPYTPTKLLDKADIAKQPLAKVINNMARTAHQAKYVFVNMLPSQIHKDSEVVRFHVEFRYPDAVLSFHMLTMLQVLIGAMVKKAISLSEFGILTPATEEEPRNQYYAGVAKRITELCGEELTEGGADIDNRDLLGLKRRARNNLSRESIGELQERAVFFFNLLKEEIYSYSPTVFQQFMRLIEKPIYELRTDGYSWGDVDNHLAIDEVDEELVELIDGLYAISALHLVQKKKNLREWSTEVATLLDVPQERILGAVRQSELHWDRELGSCVRRYK